MDEYPPAFVEMLTKRQTLEAAGSLHAFQALVERIAKQTQQAAGAVGFPPGSG